MAIPTLTLGAMNLTDWAGAAYRTAVMASGISKGAPTPINVTIDSFLQDGAVVVTQGYDNREVTLRVQFRGTNLTAVSTAEAALVAELGKPNLLTWTPASGPASVFVVVTSSMEEAPGEDGDLAEAQPLPWRYYNIRLTCEAFTRSVAETVTAALPATGTTTTLVNDGSATTNWTGSVSSGVLTGPTVVSGAVKVGTTAAVTGSVTVSETLTVAINTSSTKYLAVDWKPESSQGSPTIRGYGDGTELTRATSIGLPSGYTRTWFGPVAASSIAVLRLDSLSVGVATPLLGDPSFVRSLAVDIINRTDVKPAIGTNRQLQRRVAIGGSARGQGSLTLEHASSALGDAIVHIWPSGDPVLDAFSPACRQYRTAGPAPTTDSAMVSGAREVLAAATPTVFTIPNIALPRDIYTLVGRFKFNVIVGSVTVTVSARATIGGSAVGTALSLPPREFISPVTWGNVVLGRLPLPVLDTSDASTSATAITLTSLVPFASTLELDELWIFNSAGALVMVTCGTAAPSPSGASNRLFMGQPTITKPRPVLLVGNAADGSDAHYPADSVIAWETPSLAPPAVNVFTVTSNALDASGSFRQFNRHHTNATS